MSDEKVVVTLEARTQNYLFWIILFNTHELKIHRL